MFSQKNVNFKIPVISFVKVGEKCVKGEGVTFIFNGTIAFIYTMHIVMQLTRGSYHKSCMDY